MPITAKLGGKITDSHSTLTESAAETVGAAVKMETVTKISLGIIRHVRGGRKDLKFQPITGGIKAIVRGNGAVQDLYIYTNSPEHVIAQLEGNFRK